MQIELKSRNNGIALIMVLIVMLVLGILAGGFAYSMKVETKLARNASYDAEMEWMGRSGMELAKLYLVGQPGPANQLDRLDPRWGVMAGDTNHPLFALDPSNIPMGRGSIAIKIEDQERKFNINVAAMELGILRNALLLVGLDPAQASTVADSIMDWRDPDDAPRLSGAESDQYQTADPPYFPKNGPFDDLPELLMVRGLTPAMYWGSSGGGSRTIVFNRPASRSRFEEPVYLVGMVDLFTTISAGLVNINTASAAVLQVIPDIDENIAGAIIAARSGFDGIEGTEDDGFRSLQELGRVPGLNPAAIPLFQRFFSVRSLVFQVRVTVRIDSTTREYIGLLRRDNQRSIPLMSFYWK